MSNPAEVLVKNGKDDAFVHQVVQRAKQKYPAFPTDGCGFFLSSLLELSGYGVGDWGLAEDLATALKHNGWKRIALANYQAGDVGVTNSTDGNSNADHIFIVLERLDNQKMLVVDNQSASNQHTRRVDGHGVDGQSGKNPVDYFLRHPGAFARPITIEVRGVVVANAEGSQDLTPTGATRGWIRPIAEALGATITDHDNHSVTLSYGGKSYDFPVEFRNNKGYVALAQFRNLAGVQVIWNQGTATANIL